MRYDERPGDFFPGFSLHGSTRRATSPYGTPCPDSSVIAEAGEVIPSAGVFTVRLARELDTIPAAPVTRTR